MPEQERPSAPSQSPAVADFGQASIVAPTFLERWGVIFVAWVGTWILLVSTGLLLYFVTQRPAFPSFTGLAPEQMRGALDAYRAAESGWRDSVSYLFDLTVTKTALPVATLLLGYLFGRAKGLP